MLRFLIEKEFKQLFRNNFLPKLIMAFPIVMLLVLPWAANQEVKNIRICVVDNDHSAQSQRLAQKVAASKYFILVARPTSNAEAMAYVERGEADIILEIERRFERNRNAGAASVLISANAVNGTKGSLGSAYLAAMVQGFNAELNAEKQPSPMPSIRASTLNLFNPHLDYKIFMIPALMVMLLTMLAGFLPALNIVGEKEAGTIEQINVTPVRRLTFILAKLIPYWIIGYVVLSMCLGMAALIYGLLPAGSLATVYLYTGVYVLVVSGLGLVISNYSNTIQQAMFVMFFFVMILILMSGLFTPISSMPVWAQVFTRINPLRYFMEVMRAVYLKGSAMSELLPQLFALCGFAVVFNGWAVGSYRKSR
ncbi:MAG: ABC transporter permease [Prevotellaceae bacterium]|jgi:ABC-2 type transport system permease protein|nr:ABC transporter permease [Prevotellaceae bacterium]